MNLTKHAYLTAVHSFYKKYGLPHNPELATTEPTAYPLEKEKLEKEIEKYEASIIETYNQSCQRNITYAAIAAALVLVYKLLKKNNL